MTQEKLNKDLPIIIGGHRNVTDIINKCLAQFESTDTAFCILLIIRNQYGW